MHLNDVQQSETGCGMKRSMPRFCDLVKICSFVDKNLRQMQRCDRH